MNACTRNSRTRPLPARKRCPSRDAALPSITLGLDLSLLEQTMGPVLRGQTGMCWSPIREVLSPFHGVFHG